MTSPGKHFKNLIRRRDFLNNRINKIFGNEHTFLIAERDALNWIMDDYVRQLKNKDFYDYCPKLLKEDFEKREQNDIRSKDFN